MQIILVLFRRIVHFDHFVDQHPVVSPGLSDLDMWEVSFLGQSADGPRVDVESPRQLLRFDVFRFH